MLIGTELPSRSWMRSALLDSSASLALSVDTAADALTLQAVLLCQITQLHIAVMTFHLG